MSLDNAYCKQLLNERVMLIFKGLGPGLTDEQYYEFGSKFGKHWTANEYSLYPDRTVKNKETIPVSYFQTGNNGWGAGYMGWHSDMAHMNEISFPSRSLYMVNNTKNGSGATSWLNLELAWSRFSEEEKLEYDNVSVVQQDLYRPHLRLETFPFLKTNPRTGKISPRVNCYVYPTVTYHAWIHHIEHNGVPNSFEYNQEFIPRLYSQCISKHNTLYTHHWETGDLIIYDNFGTLHSREAVTFEEGEPDRLLKRLTINL
jgi:alpha-ketoglutarate-dependent taurine dioxygenase